MKLVNQQDIPKLTPDQEARVFPEFVSDFSLHSLSYHKKAPEAVGNADDEQEANIEKEQSFENEVR